MIVICLFMVNIRFWYGSPPLWQEITYQNLLCVQNYFITMSILILYLTVIERTSQLSALNEELRQEERSETCVYVCTLCWQMADPTPLF